MMKRIWALLPALALLVAGSGCPSGGTSKRLQGAGSSFVDPMMQEWANLYNKEKGVEVNYQPKGSSAGIAMMTERRVDFGCSDAPLNDEQLKQAKESGGEVVHVPLCMGALVPAYNLPGVSDVVFSGPVLANIYLGKITKWDDPALAELNKDKKLPGKDIAPVYRSDGSGSTYIFTDYLTKVDPSTWKLGRGTAVEWPVGIGQKGNSGVAGAVQKTEGAIGYIELIYALQNKIPYGAVLNSKGKAIKADLKSVTAAAATAEVPDDLRYSITNAPGEDAYPIAGTVWALAYTKQPAGKGKMLAEFLRWVTHEGQKHAETLHYSALPDSLVKKIDGKLAQIKEE